MPDIQPVDHHDILILLIQITVLLGTARLLGEVALRMGQSSVVGEILAGIIWGPSFLSTLLPFVGHWIMPPTPEQGHLLEIISLIGALFLLLITGLETDLALIRHHARSAIGASLGGVLFTFVSGFLLGQYLPDFLLTDPSQRLVFSLFIATSMVISSIPVIAKVLIDLNLMRRDISQTVLAAGMSDDTIGWILLSIVAGLVTSGGWSTTSAVRALLDVVVFVAISFTVGRWIVKRSLDYVQDEIISPERLLTLVIVLTFGWSAVAQIFNLEPVLGAFVIGILLGQMPRLPKEIPHRLEGMAMAIFAPIFFSVAGLRVNLLEIFGNPQLLGVALLFIALASAGKIVGTYLGARLIGRRGHWSALSFGAGLNARGAMGIIVATIGLDLGILTQEMFSIIFLMAMITSLAAPVALRWVLQRVQPKKEELARLRREELAEGSLIANVHRILLPVRGRRNIVEAAHILQTMATESRLSVTLLHVSDPDQNSDGAALLDDVGSLFDSMELLKKVVHHPNAAEAILNEAQKDYDMLVLGAPGQGNDSEVLFTPMVDYLIRVAPCATIVVKGTPSEKHWPPERILVPTNGSVAARHAAEVGFALAPREGNVVTILNVVEQQEVFSGYEAHDVVSERQWGIAHHMVEELRELGESRGVRIDTEVRSGPDPETVILDLADRNEIDLIILGTDLRAGSNRLFLGPRVERILTNAPCPVIVVNAS